MRLFEEFLKVNLSLTIETHFNHKDFSFNFKKTLQCIATNEFNGSKLVLILIEPGGHTLSVNSNNKQIKNISIDSE